MKKIIIITFVVLLIMIEKLTIFAETENNNGLIDVELTADLLEEASIFNNDHYVTISYDVEYDKEESSFVRTNIILVPKEGKTTKDICDELQKVIDYRSSQYRYRYDSTTSVKCRSTVYYNTSNQNGKTYALVTSVSGGYIIYDTSVSVTAQVVYVSSSGYYYNQTKTYYPSASTTSWSYTSPSYWLMDEVYGNYDFSCRYVLTIANTGASWNCVLQNSLF
ncbi:MAG: hypothetical protein IJH55_05170 [Romboutsia sp.]|nr:hypothetical protein [Erysipelotrichaceae bacterium]MBQ6631512.1 hypothetical protein [Romboutsia sp.]